MSRLLTALDEAIASARIPREVPFLRAERAVMRAKLGEPAFARAEIEALRAMPAAATGPVLSAWLWLAEGLVDYHETPGLRARDRVHRALALAASLKAHRLHALAAAWLAHMDFRAHDHVATAQHLATALRMAAPDHHAARSRACVVAAGAYHYAGREDLAQPWYAQARVHARAEGDSATLSAIMYNLAVLQVIDVRLIERFGVADAVKARRARLGTESSGLLDRTVRNLALRNHVPIQRAVILTGQHEFAEALALYDRHTEAALSEGLSVSESLFRADRAWCLLELGQGDAARVAARQAASAFANSTEPEELAVAHAVLGMVFDRLGLAEESRHHREAAERLHARYVAECVALLQALDDAGIEALHLPKP